MTAVKKQERAGSLETVLSFYTQLKRFQANTTTDLQSVMPSDLGKPSLRLRTKAKAVC